MTRSGSNGDSASASNPAAGTSTPTSSIPGPSSSTRTTPLAGPSSLPTSTSGSSTARRVSQAASSTSPFLSNRRATATSSSASASASTASGVALSSTNSGAPASSSQHLPSTSLAADLYGFNSNTPPQPTVSPNTSTATPTPTGYANYWRATAPSSAQSQRPDPRAPWGSVPFLGSPRVGGHSLSHSVGTNSPARPSTGAQGWSTAGIGQVNGSSWTLADPAGWSGEASMATAARAFEENSVTSFSWRISDLALLRDEVERSPMPSDGGRSISAGAGKSEVWTTQPIWGDGKWKLELVRTSRVHPDTPISSRRAEKSAATSDAAEIPEQDQNSTTVLSVYLTSMVLDYSPADLAIPARLFLGISPANTSPAAQTSRTGGFVWRHHADWTFARETEYWECHALPSLSELLEHDQVKAHDSIVLTVQVASGPRCAPAAPNTAPLSFPFQMEQSHSVPRDLVRGLQSLLDCSTTGDVILLVKERGLLRSRTSEEQDQSHQLNINVTPFPIGASHAGAEESTLVVRDRIIYAHVAILRARSEWFRDMLSSDFSEGQQMELAAPETSGDSAVVGGRRVRVLRIPQADYATVYALMRWLYVDEIEFSKSEDVRNEAGGAEWMLEAAAASGDASALPDWDWKVYGSVEEDAAVVRQDAAIQAVPESSNFAGHHYPPHSISARHSHGSLTSNLSASGGTGVPEGAPSSPTASSLRGVTRRPGEWDPRASRIPVSSSVSPLPPGPSQVQPNFNSTPVAPTPTLAARLAEDPHEHPSTHSVSSASALAIYRLAHRVHQSALANLAKAHLLSSLSPSSCFPLLLATGLYSDLHEDTRAYALLHWSQVSGTQVFEQCIDEVSAGEWGPEAGRTLRLFMQSLLSPAARMG